MKRQKRELVYKGSIPVSYTHLDVYKRQLFDIKAKISCGFVNWRPGSVCFGVRSRSASSIAATKRFTLFGLDTTKLWVILEVAILTPPLFLAFCAFIVYAMRDKNTISKTEIILNNFRTGYLLDASGERAIFSSRSLISRQRWAGNIYDDRSFWDRKSVV